MYEVCSANQLSDTDWQEKVYNLQNVFYSILVPGERYQRFLDHLSDPSCQFWVARDSSGICASLMTVFPEDPTMVYMDDICRDQDPKYKGAGSYLITQVIQKLRETNPSLKLISILAMNKRLIPYYTSLGFTIKGGKVLEYLCS